MAAKAVKEVRERRDRQLSDELSHACAGLHLLRQHRLASTPNQRVLATGFSRAESQNSHIGLGRRRLLKVIN